VVFAQGWEAGGHVRGEVATLPLVGSVVNAVAPVPVLAAGGISDGRGVAAVLALGASGAYIGTRFLASEEASVAPEYREQLLNAQATDTVHTILFDGGWETAPHRALRNSTYREWVEAGRPPHGQRPGEDEVLATHSSGYEVHRYESVRATAEFEGNMEAFSLFAGQGVGLVNQVQPAAENCERNCQRCSKDHSEFGSSTRHLKIRKSNESPVKSAWWAEPRTSPLFFVQFKQL
jgi:nitronate monooxygenase